MFGNLVEKEKENPEMTDTAGLLSAMSSLETVSSQFSDEISSCRDVKMPGFHLNFCFPFKIKVLKNTL